MVSCVSYEEKPLSPREIIDQVEAARLEGFVKEGEPFDFPKATLWMSEKSPILKELKTKYATLQSVADIATPWPNPSIKIGQDFGLKLEPGAVGKTRPFVGLGFTIPLFGRIGRQDDLNEVKAQQSFLELHLSHRELYLQLRRQFVNLYLVYRKKETQQELYRSTQTMAKITTTLRKAGASTALDEGMVAFEVLQVQSGLLKVNEEVAAIEAELSSLMGVDAEKFPHIADNVLPRIVTPPPTYKNLKELLLNNHPQLARIRSEYEVAEKKLRLEVSKQYPDISFGGAREKEVGDKTVTLGLRIGIELPLFDRNQQSVARASKYREEIRQKYLTQAYQVLAELKRSLISVKLSEQRKELLNKVLWPQAKSNLEVAEQSLKAGGIDALKYLDIKRSQQQILIEITKVEGDLWGAWLDLEKAIGHPLIKFPGEIESHYPQIPSIKGEQK